MFSLPDWNKHCEEKNKFSVCLEARWPDIAEMCLTGEAQQHSMTIFLFIHTTGTDEQLCWFILRKSLFDVETATWGRSGDSWAWAHVLLFPLRMCASLLLCHCTMSEWKVIYEFGSCSHCAVSPSFSRIVEISTQTCCLSPRDSGRETCRERVFLSDLICSDSCVLHCSWKVSGDAW